MTLAQALFTTALLAATLAPTAQAGTDILACSTKEKFAVTPTDKLDCEWKNGLLGATLAQLYSEGWRMAATAFFDGTRQVIYLERPEPETKG